MRDRRSSTISGVWTKRAVRRLSARAQLSPSAAGGRYCLTGTGGTETSSLRLARLRARRRSGGGSFSPSYRHALMIQRRPLLPSKALTTTPIKITVPTNSPAALRASPASGYSGSTFTPKS
jgi:hypothetical protein